MAIYIGNIFFICLYWFIHNDFKYNKRKTIPSTGLFVFFIAIQLILLLSMRAKTIGIDTISYYNRFHSYSSMSWADIFHDDRQELGFSALIKIISYFTDDYQLLLLCSAILTIVPIAIIINKYSSNVFLSFLLFICFGYFGFMFSGIRQGIAYGFIVYSYKFIRERKLLPFLLTIYLASLFHKSAFVFFPAYFIACLKIDKYTIAAYGILWIIAFAFKNTIYNLFENNFYNTVSDAYGIKSTGAFMWTVMMNIIAITGIILNASLREKDRNYTQFVNIMSIGAICTLFTSIGTNTKRISGYYCIFLIFLIPRITDVFENKTVKCFVNVILTIAITGMFIWSFTENEYKIIPYKFYFE